MADNPWASYRPSTTPVGNLWEKAVPKKEDEEKKVTTVPSPLMLPGAEQSAPEKKVEEQQKQANPPMEQKPVADKVYVPGQQRSLLPGMNTLPTVSQSQTQTSTGVQGIRTDPEKETALRETLIEFKKAQGRVQQLEAAGASEAANTLVNVLKKAKETSGENYGEYKRQVSSINQAMSTLSEQVKAVARKEIDPDRLWNEMPTSKKVATGIAAFLESIGAGLRGEDIRKQQKTMLDYLDDAIKKDINQQAQKIKGEKEALSTEESLLKNKYTTLNSMRQAELAQEAQTIQGAKELIQAELQAKGFTPEIIQAKTDVIFKGLDSELAKRAAEMAQQSVSTQTSTQTVEKPLSQQQLKALTGGGGQVESEYVAEAPNGKFAVFPSKKDAEEARTSVRQAFELKKLVDQALEVRQELNPIESLTGWAWGDRETGILKSLESALATGLNEIKKLGALAGPDLELLKAEIGELTALPWSNTNDRLRALKDKIDLKIKAGFKNAFSFVDRNQVAAPGSKP